MGDSTEGTALRRTSAVAALERRGRPSTLAIGDPQQHERRSARRESEVLRKTKDLLELDRLHVRTNFPWLWLMYVRSSPVANLELASCACCIKYM